MFHLLINTSRVYIWVITHLLTIYKLPGTSKHPFTQARGSTWKWARAMLSAKKWMVIASQQSSAPQAQIFKRCAMKQTLQTTRSWGCRMAVKLFPFTIWALHFFGKESKIWSSSICGSKCKFLLLCHLAFWIISFLCFWFTFWPLFVFNAWLQVRKYTGDHWKLADGDKKQVAFTVKSKNDAHVSYLDVV